MRERSSPSPTRNAQGAAQSAAQATATGTAQAILQSLSVVEAWRTQSTANPPWSASLHALKQYQAQRFERTYADWIANPKAERACRFFLDELYGPHDFTQRDAAFARIVPTMTRVLPREVSDTIEALSALHALSETLDHQMAQWLVGRGPLKAQTYLEAWQAIGNRAGRERQVNLMEAVGAALAIYTRRPLLRSTLRIMRAPAAAAGLGALQAFLESGFAAFASLPDPRQFLDAVAEREHALLESLFTARRAAPTHADDPLGQLP